MGLLPFGIQKQQNFEALKEQAISYGLH